MLYVTPQRSKITVTMAIPLMMGALPGMFVYKASYKVFQSITHSYCSMLCTRNKLIVRHFSHTDSVKFHHQQIIACCSVISDFDKMFGYNGHTYNTMKLPAFAVFLSYSDYMLTLIL